MTRCVDEPGAASPALVECVVCGGDPPDAGCDRCGHEGAIEITRCPRRVLPAETQRLMQLLDFASKGQLPVSGGVLDQTQWFLDCLQFFEAESGRLKAKQDPLGLGDQ